MFIYGLSMADRVGATGKAGDMITLVQILIVTFFVAFAVLYALDTKGVDILDNFIRMLGKTQSARMKAAG